MKIISFSLWGDKPIYLVGSIRNAKMAKEFYPDFQCWFYIHKESVPEDTIQKLKEFDNVKIIYKENKIKPATWRFEAIDDPNVELMISRDVDTQILLREKLAVDDWIKSDKLLHIMRDHPWHNYKIQAGMFGIKKSRTQDFFNISWIDKIKFYCKEEGFDYDQIFLQDVIYPLYENSRMIHASFNKFEGSECIDFPILHEEDSFKFIGEYVFEDESRNSQNIAELIINLKQYDHNNTNNNTNNNINNNNLDI